MCKVNDGRGCLLNEGPVKEVCVCKEILVGNFGGCGDLFVYACSRRWFMWLVVYCVWGVQGKYCCHEGLCRVFGWGMDKLRYTFFYMVMLYLRGVHGPAKSVWAGYLQKLLSTSVWKLMWYS